MKIKQLKNSIAFTLMEMTLVLLITSVIAAASTPILTSAVSNANSETPTAAETADVPWRPTEKYSGGGIFSSPIEETSPIAINTKFGNSAEFYGYPSLVIENNSGKSIFNAPQVQVLYSSNYSNLAMDEYENISFVSGSDSYIPVKINSTSPSADKTDIGYGNVFMGTNLLYSNLTTRSDIYNENTVILGHSINSKKSLNAVIIGTGINKLYNDDSSVLIGIDLQNSSSTASMGSVEIGSHANQKPASNSIRLGDFSSTYSSNINDISIGNSAGYFFDIRQLNGFGVGTFDNILVGNNAGANRGASTSISNANKSYNYSNIIIGEDAASIIGGTEGTSRNLARNIIIGEQAGTVTNNTNSSLEYLREDDINIGYQAGSSTSVTKRNRNINIGYGVIYGNNASFDDSINIGYYAGYQATNLDKSIRISPSKGKEDSKHFAPNSISIGKYANKGTYGSYSVAIGYKANVNTYGASKNGNVAIGNMTCNRNLGNAWCLGTVTYSNNFSIVYKTSPTSGSYTKTVWQENTDIPTMFIGRSSSLYTAITLYAANVYRPGSVSAFDTFSDVRLKTNIVPVSNSLEKIRKINIYDYTMKDDISHTPRIGVMAQEYRKIFPNNVKKEENSKKLTVNADVLIYTMLNSIKELDIFVQNTQQNLDNYIKDYLGLKSRVANLEKQIKETRAKNEQMKLHLARINEKLK